MQLTRGLPLGYDAERMAFLFTMMHGARMVDCEVSSAALDDLDATKGTRPDEREAQFLRLRDVIERVASSAFEQHGKRRGVRVRIFSKHVKSLRPA
ncbi:MULTISPECIES: DUF1488 family protein [unclassified Bradyrhizobium]|uniref:DUF1488 family protein n=1 Tax=unclassified Bradyrhizobium TaxID=2631580 RepID=UPI002810B99F|nr:MULTISPECIES: DUF1488 family protein [unclassified Bradyrhizobium]